MEWPELIVRAILTVVVIYAMYLAVRLIKWVFRSVFGLARNAGELPRKAGSAAATAVDSAKSIKDAFMDGYKKKR